MPLSTSKFRCKPILDAEKMTVEVQVIDRESDKTVLTKTYEAAKVHANLRAQVGLYGLSKLLFDRTSDVNFTDEAVTPERKIAALDEVFDLLGTGVWEKERKGGAPVVSAEVEALAEVKGVSVSEIQVALRKYTKEQREKILANPKVVELAAAKRKARDAAESMDLENL